ncbi:MAG: TetR/AcrR family transcriptional regulator [Chloroflexi bacterium]|nr:TetR/AcrR family transcriptional regulator [Chloroflexota bacterium]
MMKNTRQERQADTRKAILQTALELIAEKGLDKLSLREIARRVGYSPAGLYEYFDSKEDILWTLALEGNDRLRAAAIGISSDLPIKERLTLACLAYVDFAVQNPEHFIIMNSLTTRRASLDEPVSSESSYSVFLKIIEVAIAEGELLVQENFGAEEITYGFWSLIHGMGILRLTQLRSFEADFEKMNRKAIETFITGLQ